jgi:hypothetical protein
MDLRTMQEELPMWSVDEFEHALTHAMKALGGLAGVVDDADHARANDAGFGPEEIAAASRYYPPPSPAVKKRIADLVICATKMAQRYPGGAFDLEAEVVDRVREKNGPEAFPSASSDLASMKVLEGFLRDTWAACEKYPKYDEAPWKTLGAELLVAVSEVERGGLANHEALHAKVARLASAQGVLVPYRPSKQEGT